MQSRPLFTSILSVETPSPVQADPHTGCNRQFTIRFRADGEIPFPQVILRSPGRECLINGDGIHVEESGLHAAIVAEGVLPAGTYSLQVEGCRRSDWQHASGEDWVKQFSEMRVDPVHGTESATGPVRVGIDPATVRIYFGIHKHMHQPYYRAADHLYWDGEKDGVFGSRCGAYTRYIPDAVGQYIQGNLPHAGLSTSWSGSLIEQLDRCGREGLCGGCFAKWNEPLHAMAAEATTRGNPRISFSSFGFFHPLMPLIPGRDIVKQIALHRRAIRDSFGCDTSGVLFPPETAFHVRIIPALLEAGVRAVIYDSIHRFRSCKEYPYAGSSEGMLPPNPAEQENPPVTDWLQLHDIWAGSKISPSLLKPEYLRYEDVEGNGHKIIGVPAERYIGNEDARGGFGALQYGTVLGQVWESIVSSQTFDPGHPPFFVLHSDGDNHGGGSDSYYHHNTGRLVEWIRTDSRFQLTTIEDYLDRFPPDQHHAVHVEPGAWSGADNGDPQFRKWFSRHEQSYSPDLNSWAVLTALQNALHTLEMAGVRTPTTEAAERLMLAAETSCYWYWTGQEIWDRQVTDAANKSYGLVREQLDRIFRGGGDRLGPTIFPPWVTPENPGGKTWGENCLKNAKRNATVHTFVYDVSGLESVSLVLRRDPREEKTPMKSRGLYPTRTDASIMAAYFTADLPVGIGTVRYYIEALDRRGNRSVSGLERIHCA